MATNTAPAPTVESASRMNLKVLSDREISFSRTFNAPRDLVWQAFTDPALIAHWWGPRHLTNDVVEMDVRPGGRWRIVQHDLDGSAYGFNGEYREVEPAARSVQTFEFEGVPGFIEVDTMTLEEQNGQTTLRAHVLYQSAEHLAGMLQGHMEAGMTDGYDRLEDLLINGDRSDREISISRVVRAPRELVWAAWTQPEQVDRWYGPKGFSTETFEMDVRPGGVWRFVMRGPDGVEFPSLATYRQVAPPERLNFLYGAGEPGDGDFEMNVTFLELGDITVVTIQQYHPTAERRNEVAVWGIPGGKSTLQNLDEFVASR